MLPFAIFIDPILIKTVITVIPSLASEELRNTVLRSEIPKIKFMTILIISGLIMIILGISFLYYPNLGFLLLLKSNTINMIAIMFTFTGAASVIMGIIFGLLQLISK
jgi:hypothetical protein